MDNLQEAYLSVYEDSDIARRAKSAVEHQRAGHHGDDNAMEKESEESTKSVKKATKYKGPKATPSMPESFDFYDIVLSYLLDEGYAETEESAIVIMANMSEEWREEILDEAVLGARKGHIRSVIAQGGSKIKYVASGGDIVANDRSAQARAAEAEKTRAGRNRVNAAQFQQANKKSIERLNAKPGWNPGTYGNDDDDTSNGKRHYSLSHTNRSDRTRRAKG